MTSRSDTVSLSSATKWLSGGTPNRAVPSYWGGSIPWISAATLKRSKIETSHQHLTALGVQAGSKMAPKGAMLVLVRGMALHHEIRIGIATRPVSFNQDVKALIPKRGLLPEFLLYSVQAQIPKILNLVSSAGSGTGVLDTQLLQRLPIWIPDEPEQHTIVAAMESADGIVETLERLIAKKQAIKQGMVQQLLMGRTRLPGFSSEWTEIQAGDVGTFRGGSGFSPRFQGSAAGEIPFYKVSDMNSIGNELFLRRSNNYVSQSERKQMGAVLMPADAIVFAKVGAAVFLERKRLLTAASCIDNNMAAFTVDRSRVDVRFMHYVLSRFPMSSLVTTGALPSLNGRQLRSIPISLPSDLSEQEAIASVLADADAEISALSARLKKARAIKLGMLHQLLTGRTRLPIEKGAV